MNATTNKIMNNNHNKTNLNNSNNSYSRGFMSQSLSLSCMLYKKSITQT